MSSSSFSSFSSPSSSSPSLSEGFRPLENLRFDHSAWRSLPSDSETKNSIRENIPNAMFSFVSPTPIESPKIVALSADALSKIDISINPLGGKQMENPKENPMENEKDFIEYFSGNKTLPGAQYAAWNYCGFQFGHFSGQLGDGAAISLGQLTNRFGDHFEISLKGAGPTPYSRHSDGRKVLRSSVREFLCSEGMHFLGIPTTRGGVLIVSEGSTALRDQFYSGNPKREKCAVLTRIAETFIRFGSLEVAKGRDKITGRSGPSAGNISLLRSVVSYVGHHFYSNIWNSPELTPSDKICEMFSEITQRTAKLVSQWQSVGFVHGVLNTDNMSIVGITIDYGPYGFIESFEEDFMPNTSDENGRYSYSQQPNICQWNIGKLGEMLWEVLQDDLKQRGVSETSSEWRLLRTRLLAISESLFSEVFKDQWAKSRLRKLGLFETLRECDAAGGKSSLSVGDEALWESLFETMELTGADFTNTFRAISLIGVEENKNSDAHEDDKTIADRLIIPHCDSLSASLDSLTPRIPPQQLVALSRMIESDPSFLESLESDQREFLEGEIQKLSVRQQLSKMTATEKKSKDSEVWARWIHQYRERISEERKKFDGSDQEFQQKRRILQNSANPKYVLRNWMAQLAIDAAEMGDFSVVRRIQKILEDPYALNEQNENSAEGGECRVTWDFTGRGPEWAKHLKVSCSS